MSEILWQVPWWGWLVLGLGAAWLAFRFGARFTNDADKDIEGMMDNREGNQHQFTQERMKRNATQKLMDKADGK